MHPLAGTVAHFLDPLDCSAGIVVAVSGGPDSVALLRLLLEQPRPAPLLVLAHLNHRLRGADSDADEAFVRDLQASLEPSARTRLEIRCEKIDVAGRARAAGENLEKTARRARYEWLTQVAAEYGARHVATGHTADDQAETVLHRLLRGTGLRGLRGVARRRVLGRGVEVIRPLLSVSRAELLTYLSERGQAYRTDRSNFDLRLTRNRIRHELLPLLADHYNPAIVSQLCRLAEQAGHAYGRIEAEAAKLLARAERSRAGSWVVLDRPMLAAAPRNLVRELFRLVWEREGWPLNAMTFDAWDRLALVTVGGAASVDLPGGVRARAQERVVQVGRAS